MTEGGTSHRYLLPVPPFPPDVPLRADGPEPLADPVAALLASGVQLEGAVELTPVVADGAEWLTARRQAQ